jgi:hypothetical protein
MLNQIDAVLNHRAFEAGTGLSGRVLNAVPGTPTYDFGQRVEQIQGQTFLQAFESLRGGGAITEIEGQRGMQAIARLNTGQSSSDFRQSLRELREIIAAAQERARNRVPQSGATAPGVPIPGAPGMAAEPPPAQRPPLSSFQR